MSVVKLPAWIRRDGSNAIVRFHIQPKASRTELVGEHGDGATARLKVRVAAPPIDDAANEELLQFLKSLTRLPRYQLQIVRGKTSRQKDVLFIGMRIDELTKIFDQKA